MFFSNFLVDDGQSNAAYVIVFYHLSHFTRKGFLTENFLLTENCR